MRFGAFVPQGWRLDLAGIEPTDHWDTMTSVASALEAAGFESAWVYDHFHTVPEPTQEPTYEAFTMMAALAAATGTIRLGQMCTCNSYRPPSFLAKVAASIDVISGGRLEMGIGAGWYQEEYEAYGYEFPRPAVRIGQLDEAVRIMKLMWAEDEAHFHGRYYTVNGAICQPKPIQDPHPPLWIAGGGEQLTLRVAAEHAAYTNFGIDLDQFQRKSAVLEEHCRDLGRDFDSIIRSSNFNIICAATESDVEDKLAWLEDKARTLVSERKAVEQREEFRRFSGTPEQIVERLRPWADAGLEYTIVYFPDPAYDLSGVELFAREVIPAFA